MNKPNISENIQEIIRDIDNKNFKNVLIKIEKQRGDESKQLEAINKVKKAKLPYIVLLANPTTGGVTASFAMLGDIHIAEPGAIIGFAGRRVIEETVKEKLPEDFQTAEYLKSHGMIDIVVPRSEQKSKISKLLKSLTFYLN